MSQADLGAISGVTFQQIQKYEKGTNRITAARLFEFASALSVSVSYFFENAPNVAEDASSNDGLLLDEFLNKSDCVALVRAYMQIKDRRVRNSILALVRSVAREESEVIPDAS